VKLEEPSLNDITVGRLVVLMPPSKQGAGGGYDDLPQMRFVERVDGGLVFLEPTAMFLDDDDVSETFSTGEALKRLRLPRCEVGDRVFYRTRPARLTKCSPNDLHAHVVFDDDAAAGCEAEHYTSLIHLDFSPTLIAFV
jgi:hypothetical protein